MKGPDLFLYRLWYSPDIEDTNSAAFFMLGYGSDFGSTFEEILLVKGIPGCCAYDVCYKKSRCNRRRGKKGQSNYS